MTQQDELIESLEQALTSQDIPEITQTLLNLAEFMEHCDKVSVHGVGVFFVASEKKNTTKSDNESTYERHISRKLTFHYYYNVIAGILSLQHWL